MDRDQSLLWTEGHVDLVEMGDKRTISILRSIAHVD